MQKGTDFIFNLLGGAAALLVLGCLVVSVVMQVRNSELLSDRVATEAAPAVPSKSPWIAFTSEMDGNAEIYAMRADGSELVNLTNDPADDTNPFWSPDGEYIAFESDRNGDRQVFVMAADGSKPARVSTLGTAQHLPVKLDGVTNPWSPDGRQLLFLQTNSDGSRTLASVNLETGDLIQLITGRISFHGISWSPDGKHIAVILNDPRNAGDQSSLIPDLYLLTADGSRAVPTHRLIPPNEALWASASYAWARDGRALFLIASNLPVSRGGYSVDSQGNYLYEWKVYEIQIGSLGVTPRVTTRSALGGWWESTYFMVDSPAPGASIVSWVNADGTLHNFNLASHCGGTQDQLSPTVEQSSNGNLVLAVVCVDNRLSLFTLNLAGTEVLPILTQPASSPAPPAHFFWSPDDTYLAFYTNSAQGQVLQVVNRQQAQAHQTLHLVRVAVSGGDLPFSFFPSWHP